MSRRSTMDVVCLRPAPAERRTPNAKRQTPNAKRQTPNAERQMPHFAVLKCGCSFVVPTNERKFDSSAHEGRKPDQRIGPDVHQKCLLMNYPYSSYILETQRAKQQLERLFQAHTERRTTSLSLPAETFLARNDHQNPDRRRRLSSQVSRIGNCLKDFRRYAAFSKNHYWTRGDMGALSFTLTLLLLVTAAAAQTDRPMLWLLVGPVPLAAGFLAIAFFRRGFHPSGYLRSLRRHAREGHRKDRFTPRASCQCQCR